MVATVRLATYLEERDTRDWAVRGSCSMLWMGALVLCASCPLVVAGEKTVMTCDSPPIAVTLVAEEPPHLGDTTWLRLVVAAPVSAVRAPETGEPMVRLRLSEGIEPRHVDRLAGAAIRRDHELEAGLAFEVLRPGQHRVAVSVRGTLEDGRAGSGFAALYFTVGADAENDHWGWEDRLLAGEDTGRWPASAGVKADEPRLVPAADANLNETTRLFDPLSRSLANSVTVTGRYIFRDRHNESWVGYHRNLMRLVNGTTNAHLAWTYSDADGDFTFPAVTNPGADGISVRVYALRYLAGHGYGTCVSPDCPDNAAADSGSYDDFFYRYASKTVVGDGVQDLGTLTSSFSITNNLRAMWIKNDLDLASNHLEAHSTVRGPFTAEWAADSTDGTYYNDDGNMHFTADAATGTNNTVLHEVGHNVMFNAGTFPEVNDCPRPHYFDYQSGSTCGWTEGWAHTFQVLVNDVHPPQRCYPPDAEDCFDIEVDPSWDNCGGGWYCGPTTSDTVEGHVVGALWDIYDADDDGWDVYSYGAAPIYTLLESADYDSFDAWWAAWLAEGYSEDAVMSLYQDDIDYRSTVACPDDGYEVYGSDGSDDTCWGAPINVGETQSHALCDHDWIWFNPVAGATYRIETSNLLGEADTIIYLHESCGPELTYDADGGYLNASRIDHTSSSGVTIDVRVENEYSIAPPSYVRAQEYDITVTCIDNCNGPPFFEDGFESGDCSSWSGEGP
jgi:hypothetical protein